MKIANWMALFGFCCLLFVHKAQAQVIQITSVQRASYHDLGSAATDTPVIYGGIAGGVSNGGCASPSTTSLCNNCATAAQADEGDELACNRSRIHGSLKLRIEFTVTGDVKSNSEVSFGFDENQEFSNYEKSGSVSKGSTGFVQIPWSEICSLSDDTGTDATCDDTGVGDGVNDQFTLFISIDDPTFEDSAKRKSITVRLLAPDGDSQIDHIECDDPSPTAGICRFYAFPGDQKVYIGGTDESNFLVINSCSSNVTAARLFYYQHDGTADGTNAFLQASYHSDNFVDLDVNEDCAPEGDWVVNGLENGQSYYFRLSMVDIAKNNFFLTSIADEILDNADCGNALSDATDTSCAFIAQPGSVLGLLPEDLNCFIATAAYGTVFEKNIQILREFRNQFLLTNPIGQAIVEKYYEWGPIAAKFISGKPNLRSLTRVALLPVLSLAWLSLYYGLFGAFLVVVFMMFLLVYVFRIYRERETHSTRGDF